MTFLFLQFNPGAVSTEVDYKEKTSEDEADDFRFVKWLIKEKVTISVQQSISLTIQTIEVLSVTVWYLLVFLVLPFL